MIPTGRDGWRARGPRLTSAIACVTALAAVMTATATAATPQEQAKAVLSYDRPATYGSALTADVLVPMRDGFKLTCDLRRPAGADGKAAAGRFPSLVVDYLGYGRKTAEGGAEWWTGRGYNTLACNTRGSQGIVFTSPAPNSIDFVNPWSPLEQRDNFDVIEWLASRSWSTGRVGQTGGSYGGITTFLVAGRQKPPALKAIIPVEAVTDIYRQFAYPGGVATGLGANFQQRGIFPAGCALFCGEPTVAIRQEAEWRKHSTYDEYWEQRATDPAEIEVPTLHIAGTRDHFTSNVEVFSPALNRRPDFSLVLGPWEHIAPESPDNEENAMPRGVYLAWFDRWVAQDERAPRFPKVLILEQPKATEDGPWLGLPAWPPRSTRTTRLRTTDDGLRREPAATGGTPVVYDAMTGSVSFASEPLTEDTVLAGPLRLGVRAAFSGEDGVVIGAIEDIAPDGTATELAPPVVGGNGRGYLRASHRSSDVRPEPVEPGRAYDLVVQIPSKVWRFSAGHRIQVTLRSYDGSTALEQVPSGTVTVHPGDGTFIDLPLAEPGTLRAEARTADSALALASPASCRRTVRLPRGSRLLRITAARRKVAPKRRARAVGFTVPADVAGRRRLRVRVGVRLADGRRTTLVRVVTGCRRRAAR